MEYVQALNKVGQGVVIRKMALYTLATITFVLLIYDPLHNLCPKYQWDPTGNYLIKNDRFTFYWFLNAAIQLRMAGPITEVLLAGSDGGGIISRALYMTTGFFMSSIEFSRFIMLIWDYANCNNPSYYRYSDNYCNDENTSSLSPQPNYNFLILFWSSFAFFGVFIVHIVLGFSYISEQSKSSVLLASGEARSTINHRRRMNSKFTAPPSNRNTKNRYHNNISVGGSEDRRAHYDRNNNELFEQNDYDNIINDLDTWADEHTKNSNTYSLFSKSKI